MNIIEKILAQKGKMDLVLPKDRVIIEPSKLFIYGNNTLNVIKEFYEQGFKKVLHPSRYIFISEETSQLAEIKDFCKMNELDIKAQFERSLNDFLRVHQNSLNELVVAGLDSRIGAIGAYGAVPLIISPAAMARCLGTGNIEMAIPDTVYIEITGSMNKLDPDRICDYLHDYFKDSLVGCGIIMGGNSIMQLNEKEQLRMMRFVHDSGGALGIISAAGPLGQVESAVKINAHHISPTPYNFKK